jgi:hypothetical protein
MKFCKFYILTVVATLCGCEQISVGKHRQVPSPTQVGPQPSIKESVGKPPVPSTPVHPYRGLEFSKLPLSPEFPRTPEDFVQAASYAEYCVGRQQYAEAARNFEFAANVPGGTGYRHWEREMWISASVAWLCAGESSLARTRLDEAKRLRAHAPSSQRLMVLDAVLNGRVDPALAPALKAVLPRKH